MRGHPARRAGWILRPKSAAARLAVRGFPRPAGGVPGVPGRGLGERLHRLVDAGDLV